MVPNRKSEAAISAQQQMEASGQLYDIGGLVISIGHPLTRHVVRAGA
jgi:hypothetical protein